MRKLETPELLTIREVAKWLRVKPSTIRHWSNKGLLHVYRLGPRGDRRFSREEIERFLGLWTQNGSNKPKEVPHVSRT